MTITTNKTTSFVRRLNSRLKVNPAWTQLFAAVDTVVRERVTEPRTELATIRDSRRHHRGDWITTPDGRRAIINHIALNGDNTTATVYVQLVGTNETLEIVLPTNLKDREILIQNSRYHGFNYFSDTLTTQDYASIQDWIEYFWPESGTDSYYRFIGFLKKVRLDADVLWTSEEGLGGPGDTDNYPFLEANNDHHLKPVWEGGINYPTSHVQLRWDPVQYGDLDEEDIFNLFYLLAPIQLVLERLVADIEAGDLLLSTVAVGQISLFEAGISDFSKIRPSGEDIIYAALGAIEISEAGTLLLPRKTLIPSLNYELNALDGLRFSAEMGEMIADYQSLGISFFNGDQLLFSDTTSGTRIYVPAPGVIGVVVPPDLIPTDLESVRYELSMVRDWWPRTIMQGTITLLGETTVHDLNFTREFGMRMSFAIKQGGVKISARDYDFTMVVYRDGTPELNLSTGNGRLYPGSNGDLAVYVPQSIFNFYDDIVNPVTPLSKFTYRLYWRRHSSAGVSHSYANLLEGNIVVQDPYINFDPVGTFVLTTYEVAHTALFESSFLDCAVKLARTYVPTDPNLPSSDTSYLGLDNGLVSIGTAAVGEMVLSESGFIDGGPKWYKSNKAN